MDYREHTKQRFKERFLNKSISELSDEDYDNICVICRNTDAFLKANNQHRKSSVKKLIFYKEIRMCCIVSKKRKIVKTIYTVNKRLLKKFTSC